MTKNNTATVETITAEVRVLMVGSRQVTLSVYNQLDYVGPSLIEPLGRVNPKDGEWKHVDVVGRSADGTLCRSCVTDNRQWGYTKTADGPPYPFEPQGEMEPRVAEWRSLPLIILAGLR
jgi:hypothetical protein